MEIANLLRGQKEEGVITTGFGSKLQILERGGGFIEATVSVIENKVHAKPIINKRPKAGIRKGEVIITEYN